jgi:hypothetical protein
MESWEKPLETNTEYGYIDALLVEFVSSRARSIILFFSESDANIWAKRRSRQLGLKVKKSRRHRGVYFERINRMDGRFLCTRYQQNSGTKMRVMNWQKMLL